MRGNVDWTARHMAVARAGRFLLQAALLTFIVLLAHGPAKAQGFFQWFGPPPPPPFELRRSPRKPAASVRPAPAAKPLRAARPAFVPRVAAPNPVTTPNPAPAGKVPLSTAMAAPRPDSALAGIALDPRWPKQLYVIGDSVMLGAKPFLPKAFPDWQVTFQGRPALMVRKAIEELPEGPLGSVAVVAVGYNSLWQKDRQNFQVWADRFDKNADDMIAALKQRGVHKVVWVLLREVNPEMLPGGGVNGGAAVMQYHKYSWYFPYVNERLRAAKLRHPDLALADWVNAARQGGITYDAIHLNPRGAELMVNVVRVAVGLDPLPPKTIASILPEQQPAQPQPAAATAPAPRERAAAEPSQAAAIERSYSAMTEFPQSAVTESAQPAAAAPPEMAAAEQPTPPPPPEGLPSEIRKSVAEAATIPSHAPLLNPTYAFRDCPECPEIVVVPAASFTMGSPEDETGREANEGPQRVVTINRPFAIGKFEVTFAEWDACVAEDGCKSNPTPRDEGWGQDKQPVVNVSWDDAVEYVAWLSRRTGKTYRLLSEAEWEYASRAGTESPYPTGEAITAAQANFQPEFDADGSKREGEYREQPLAVGSFGPNALGLHDMQGNVSEWVEDNWHESYAGAPIDGSVWQGGDTSLRVLRGGSWYSFGSDMRSASRRGDQPDHRSSEIGFRVARAL
jgi:formylglycine-generating enzyme required for sulfatase activity